MSDSSWLSVWNGIYCTHCGEKKFSRIIGGLPAPALDYLWNETGPTRFPTGPLQEGKHLLWTLYYVARHPPDFMAADCFPGTAAERFLAAVASVVLHWANHLHVICFNPNHITPHGAHGREHVPCVLPDYVRYAVDTVTFRIGLSRHPENAPFISYKLGGCAGWKLQLLVALDDGEIVGCSELFPGATSDLAIWDVSSARKDLEQNQLMAIGDEIYGDTCSCVVSAPGTLRGQLAHDPVQEQVGRDLHAHRAIVENVNSRLYNWGILNCRFYRKSSESFPFYCRVCCELTELKRRFKPIRKQK
eukprot:TRINITY_DN3914_c0_g2_i3.p1 TRINITY_DN3914_c0_g2~~TRINITY_DN3914_c0_g2_i3.p1  ORF type:complete len:303 (-),score=7.53 TRINITY_DN3914_c0_g2_i3:6-914(-)